MTEKLNYGLMADYFMKKNDVLFISKPAGTKKIRG